MLKPFTGPFARYLIRVLEQILDRTVLLDQLHRGFLTDAGNPRNIIRGVSGQAQYFQHLLWRHAEPLDNFVAP